MEANTRHKNRLTEKEKKGKGGEKIPDPSSISMLPVASLKLELCVIKLGINLAGVSYRASNRPSCSKFIVFVFNMEVCGHG